ncbi:MULTISPECIES: alpha/beta hydrolase [Winogradskyella]|uniref:alpha/beta hydrolase n=1 Tax=Winogradskyella TaxID=286104 RepID=UPI001C53CB3F|nr:MULTISPECIES: alpha/beta hydrolase-fold protein [Winogradskyella]
MYTIKNYSVFIIMLFIGLHIQSQAIYKTIDSDRLGGSRELKIQLPRNYNPEEKHSYPLIIVLDGDYLFEPIAGNIDYQSYWEDIPDCIVVGVNQSETREEDFFYGKEAFFPLETGAAFYEFIAAELLPFIEDNYNASNFRIVVGHDLSANFINYYLFKDDPIFRGYVALSPDFAPEMMGRLKERLSILEHETFYYMATADADIRAVRTAVLEADALFTGIENENFLYRFDDFDDANHYSLVGQGIPKALNQIFTLFKPISAKEYSEKVLTFEGTPFEYLTKKYDDIEHFYGFEKKLIENDIRAIAAASNKKDDSESLKSLSKLVNKTFPKSMLSAYYSGLYNEKYGSLKKALLLYKSGLLLEPSQSITKDIMLDKMYEIQDEIDR